MSPEPDARIVECAEVTVRLPDEVAGLTQRETNAQATGAWGDPASVLFWCGAPAPGPTTDRCVSVNGIDWIIDESEEPRYRFTSYGRFPTVTVVVDNAVVSGTTAITDLSSAVSVTAVVNRCVGAEDLELG